MPFPLLLLPTELRLQILTHLLIHRTPIHTTSAHALSPPHPTPLNLTPAILLTCHQLHREGLPLLYSANTFQAHPQLLTSSIFAIDPTHRVTASHCIKLIKRWHVRVRLDCDPQYLPEVVSEAFSGCESLEVEVFRASWGSGGFEALEGFGWVRGVRRARVFGSLGRGVARRLEAVMESKEGQRERVERWSEDGNRDEGWVGREEGW